MIFIDTSFLISAEVETDKNHHEALKLRDEIIGGKFGSAVISDYIFDETVTVTFARSDLRKAVLVATNLQNSAEMLKIEEKHFQAALELFKSQELTKFSFTDCTTLAIMKSSGIRNIATFDKDFGKVKEINVIGAGEK